jgi:hypothetical protein
MPHFAISRVFASRIPRPALFVVIGMLLVTMTGACGKKGPVRPKLETPIPPPEELTLQQHGPLFVLGWKIPSAGKDASEAHQLTGFRIRRMTFDPAEGCPTCRDPQTEVAELDIRYPEPGQRIDNHIYWRDLDIQPGNGYRYAISAMILGGQEGSAATIHLVAQPPPPAPTGLLATAGEGRVSLEWTAPVLPEEMQLVGYNLYRRSAQLPFSLVPVNSKPLKETRLLDRGLDNGRSYEYRVSAVIRIGDQFLESLASNEVMVTPREGL